jgi:hypothetical protein
MRTLRSITILFMLFGTAAILLSLQCKSSTILQSSRENNSITVDGNLADWNGLLIHAENVPVVMGAANNDSALYLCFVSDDRETVRQIVRHGLTVWFETPRSRWGIRFPMGMEHLALPSLRPPRDDPEAMNQAIARAFDILEIVGPGKNDTVPMKTAIADSFGITVKADPAMEKLSYELRVPLHADSSRKYAALPGNDSTVAITVESAAPASYSHNESMNPGQGIDGDNTGFGQRGGNMGGGAQGGMPGMGMRRGGAPVEGDNFEFGVRVKLAGKK